MGGVKVLGRLGWGRRDPARALAKQANAARDSGDWPLAARLFGRVAALRPDKPAYLVQQGHALKESGDPAAAIAAYRAAADAAPNDVDARIHLVALLREAGDVAGAASVYAALIRIDPVNAVARRGAVELGRRDLLDGGEDPRAAGEARLGGLADALHRATRAAEAAVAVSALSTGAYDLFRRTYPLRPPPATGATGRVHIVVDARRSGAAALRATLAALGDLVDTDWSAQVLPSDDLRDHPVASFAAIDRRIAFDDTASSHATHVLLLDGDTQPTPLAVAWLRFALDRTGATAAYGDHDRREESWRDGVIHRDPVLFDAFDPERMRVQSPPAMLLLTADAWSDGNGDIRDRVLKARRAVHVPRLLSSRYAMPASARMAPADLERSGPSGLTAPRAPAASNGTPIAVIIPTRDESASLDSAIATMQATATDPGRLRFVIVDNRSRLEETRNALATLARGGTIVVPFDEGFNWSRANNLGAAAVAAPLLVFANNDVEMVTPGWDVAVEDALGSQGIGAVGARLLYPDGTIQHAGVLFDTDDRVLSVHEGVGQHGDAAGPDGRWQQRRAVSAVTGAFLAVRRDSLAAVGGFDEHLFVAYNDIDLCLKLREQGLAVLYEPAITLTHVESKTRGLNHSAGQIAWDEGELMTLANRWGAALRVEPGYNPYWARGGAPFTGYREPPLSMILAHIDLARRPTAWAVEVAPSS
jgi:GT2 family glycosyltransferase/tetratricopeptide (TPR) repeat protein